MTQQEIDTAFDWLNNFSNYVYEKNPQLYERACQYADKEQEILP